MRDWCTRVVLWLLWRGTFLAEWLEPEMEYWRGRVYDYQDEHGIQTR